METKKTGVNKKKFVVDDISFETPALTAQEREDALLAFAVDRRQQKAKLSPELRLKTRLLRLRIQIENYLQGQEINSPVYRFGSFLEAYMESLDLNRTDFAKQISVSPSELSQLLHHHRDPNDKICMRLEHHSNRNFPAYLWYDIVARQNAWKLQQDESLRKAEKANVHSTVKITL